MRLGISLKFSRSTLDEPSRNWTLLGSQTLRRGHGLPEIPLLQSRPLQSYLEETQRRFRNQTSTRFHNRSTPRSPQSEDRHLHEMGCPFLWSSDRSTFIGANLLLDNQWLNSIGREPSIVVLVAILAVASCVTALPSWPGSFWIDESVTVLQDLGLSKNEYATPRRTCRR